LSSEPTSFLYPFIEAEERDAGRLVADLARSALAKMEESRTLRLATLERCRGDVERAADAVACCLRGGGRVLAFGNGGSATDAAGTVELFGTPPRGRAFAAMSLADNRAVLTALANDIGIDVVFSRQIIAHGRPGDVALGFSTSGDSANVLRAFDEAHQRHLLTIGFCGYEGGAMAASPALDHCLIVRSDSVHRIQETQDALMFELWSTIQRRFGEGSML
jgi:D-sedoheptulose 7-phosphate isomerase